MVKPIRKHKESVLDEQKELIIELIEKDISGVRIHKELIKEAFKIIYPSMARYLESMKGTSKVYMRFHTKDGEKAQVGFGYIELLPNNNGKKAKV